MIEQGYWLLAIVGSSIAFVGVIAHAIARQDEPQRVPVRIRTDRRHR